MDNGRTLCADRVYVITGTKGTACSLQEERRRVNCVDCLFKMYRAVEAQ